jgi:hypothetical protein
MANSMVVWDGLAELYVELKNLPTTLTGEAAHLVEAAANGVYVDIKSAYPQRTGNLRKGMAISQLITKGQFVAGAVVTNRAPHATLFELGTQARHTTIGVNRGTMPPGRVFVPRVVKARRKLTQDLKDMVTRHGAVVTGDA